MARGRRGHAPPAKRSPPGRWPGGLLCKAPWGPEFRRVYQSMFMKNVVARSGVMSIEDIHIMGPTLFIRFSTSVGI